MPDLAKCRICGHVHDPEDGHCDSLAHVGVGMCPCPGEWVLHADDDSLREALDILVEALSQVEVRGQVGDVENYDEALISAHEALALRPERRALDRRLMHLLVEYDAESPDVLAQKIEALYVGQGTAEVKRLRAALRAELTHGGIRDRIAQETACLGAESEKGSPVRRSAERLDLARDEFYARIAKALGAA
jgi:hypothetical protein